MRREFSGLLHELLLLSVCSHEQEAAPQDVVGWASGQM